jgi:hypothetical protein
MRIAPHRTRDNDAVAGLPLEMIVILIVLAISLPIAFDRFNAWDMDRTEREVKMEIQFLFCRAKMLYFAGENNTDTVELNFRSGYATRIESIIVGANASGLWAGVTYDIEGQPPETDFVYEPQFPIACSEGGKLTSLELGPGKVTLFLSTERNSEFLQKRDIDLYVDVSVVD